MYRFFEKCIMQEYAEINNILFVGSMTLRNPLAQHLDQCIKNMRKKQGGKELDIQILNIVREDDIY